MTTIYEAFRKQALADFDAQVAQRAGEIRARMQAAGCTAEEIDAHLATFQPGLDEQRRGISELVRRSLQAADVPLETTIAALN